MRMSEQASEPAHSRCPVWVKVLLGVSLALNLAIAGLIAGLALRGGPMRSDVAGLGYALPYIMALDRDERHAVFKAVRGAPGLPDRRARRGQFREMISALRSDPFDREAVEAVLSQQANAVSQVQDAAQAEWLGLVAAMGAEDRAAYVDEIEEVLRKGPNRRDRPPRK